MSSSNRPRLTPDEQRGERLAFAVEMQERRRAFVAQLTELLEADSLESPQLWSHLAVLIARYAEPLVAWHGVMQLLDAIRKCADQSVKQRLLSTQGASEESLEQLRQLMREVAAGDL